MTPLKNFPAVLLQAKLVSAICAVQKRHAILIWPEVQDLNFR